MTSGGERLSTGIQKGSWGLLELTEGKVGTSLARSRGYQRQKLLDRVSGFIRGNRREVEQSYSLVEAGIRIVRRHGLQQSDLERIPLGQGTKSQKHRAEFVEMIAGIYQKDAPELKNKGLNIKYHLGLLLSDMFELMPPETAARVLLSASTPEISGEIKERANSEGLPEIDVHVLAVEAVLLLPRNKRRELFVEMAKQDTRQEGRPSLFFRSIVGAFNDRNSPFFGIGLIYANLEGEKAQEKVLEVQDDFLVIGALMREQGSAGTNTI